MVDRVVDPENDIPVEDVDDVLKAVIVAVLDEAADKMEEGKDVIPFTGLAVKENLFIETHPGDDAEECFLAARKEVQGARGATAYAFCYDGYIDTDSGEYMENNNAGWDYSDEYYDDYDPWSDPGDGWDDYAYDDEGWGDYF